MEKKISIICPTRGRPDKLLNMMNSVLNNASSPELVEFILYVDSDDKSDYEMIRKKAVIIRSDRTDMSMMVSSCISKASGNIICSSNDDVLFRTKKWDDIIYENLKLYPDNIFLLHPNDLNKGQKLCTFPIFSKELFLKFPGLLPGNLTNIDFHIHDIFLQLKGLGFNRIKFLDNLILEHLHYTLGKSNMDDTYSDRHRFAGDDIFISYADLRFKISNKIASYINNKSVSTEILSTKLILPKMTNMQFFMKNTFMFWFSNASLLYRSKLWFYMIARRIYNIFIYQYKKPKI
jgi:hypothetical protein